MRACSGERVMLLVGTSQRQDEAGGDELLPGRRDRALGQRRCAQRRMAQRLRACALRLLISMSTHARETLTFQELLGLRRAM
jgi:hypothetical protein